MDAILRSAPPPEHVAAFANDTDSAPAPTKMAVSFSRGRNTMEKPHNDTPTWVIPTIVVVGGALVTSLVYYCCRIIHQKD